MKHFPRLHTFTTLHSANDAQADTAQGWVPARPLGYPSFRNRVRLAWGVFTGRYDAFKWPGGQ